MEIDQLARVRPERPNRGGGRQGLGIGGEVKLRCGADQCRCGPKDQDHQIAKRNIQFGAEVGEGPGGQDAVDVEEEHEEVIGVEIEEGPRGGRLCGHSQMMAIQSLTTSALAVKKI